MHPSVTRMRTPGGRVNASVAAEPDTAPMMGATSLGRGPGMGPRSIVSAPPGSPCPLTIRMLSAVSIAASRPAPPIALKAPACAKSPITDPAPAAAPLTAAAFSRSPLVGGGLPDKLFMAIECTMPRPAPTKVLPANLDPMLDAAKRVTNPPPAPAAAPRSIEAPTLAYAARAPEPKRPPSKEPRPISVAS